MSRSRRPLVAGNWKMNGLRASLAEIAAIAAGSGPAQAAGLELLICPPATLVAAAAAQITDLEGAGVRIGGQDCHPAACGAHTGDISADMLRDAGASHVIVGHSERRADHGETDAMVKAKAEAAQRAGLVAIVCIGETQAEREAGKTLDVVGAQLAGSLPDGASAANLVIAYEPVWAIGSGLTPTLEDVTEVHGFIRERLVKALPGTGTNGGDAVRILYGGSVKPSNAAELMAVTNVDGALVGGASLLAKDFLAIASVYR
ncbi:MULTISPECIES: triose-phosphate isomerase [unclassified Beijerinckia]|uniref:triose-phosphate isomerase n=1 Tax=unclassified Beijerinckia TaxID=2638183 RepID=UPI000894A2F4|nr:MULTISPECIES: triose-phosphate isomerase [unclassified Beijerinckia]MDH7794823.1 triosephosphate isomerase [Beijerinckia sp. GAS462]SEB76590.1 triosephosphate isomerase [Beijerinckia sp. 28-YEA-48]